MKRAALAALAALACTAIASARASAQPAGEAGSGTPAAGAGAASTGSEGARSTANAEQILKLEGDEIPDFDKIRTPDSPAFTLLGVSPTQIERPTTPKEFTAVLSKFTSEGDVVIPKNLAVEFAPVALLTMDQDVDAYLDRSFGEQLWQNLTLSLATATNTRDVMDSMGATTTHTDSRLGIGVRSMSTITGEQHGCSSQDLESLVELSKLEAVSSTPEGQQLIRDTMARRTAAPPEEAAKIDADFAAKSKRLKETLTAKANKLASLCIKEVASAHRGWIMDIALASGFTFPDSAAKQGRYSLGSVWADIAYESSHASAVLLGRLRDDKTSGDHDYFSEVGARGIIAKDAYAASAEMIWRHSVKKSMSSTAADNSYRLALALDIHISDASWLTLSFGRDFASSEAGSLFSLANLKYGVGDPKVKLKR